MKKILVSIVNYNSWNHIRELFDYIDKVKLDTDMVDFCVIDNKSTSEDIPQLQKYCIAHWIHFLQAQKNGGFAYGNNRIIEYMTGLWKSYEYYFLINPDMLIEDKDFFNTIYDQTLKHKADIIWPMICEYGNKDIIHFAWWFLKWPVLYPTKLWRWKNDTWLYKDIECDYINGSAMMISSKLWHTIWGMDESYFLYFEETDFCRQAKLSWSKIICTTKTKIYDKISGSVGRMSRLYVRQMIKNYKRFAGKYIHGVHKMIRWLFYIWFWCPVFIFLSIKSWNRNEKKI